MRRVSTRCGSAAPRRGLRRPPLRLSEAAEIVADLVEGGARVICFMKARKGVEMISRMVRDHLQDTAPLLADKVMPYRRRLNLRAAPRDIEAKLTRGELRAVIATNALSSASTSAHWMRVSSSRSRGRSRAFGSSGVGRDVGARVWRSTSPATMRWISTSVRHRTSSSIGRWRTRSWIRSASQIHAPAPALCRAGGRRSRRTTCVLRP